MLKATGCAYVIIGHSERRHIFGEGGEILKRKVHLAIESGLGRFRDRPVLLVWGERDFCFTPAFREEWQRRFPAAEAHAFADAGHYVVEDALDRVVPILERFLAPVASGEQRRVHSAGGATPPHS